MENKKLEEEWDQILEDEWYWNIDWEFWFFDSWLLDNCNWNCDKCIGTFVWDIQIRSNMILCCPSHPETWEVNENWFCPNIDLKTWLCNVYKWDNYPAQCENYHCKTHSR